MDGVKVTKCGLKAGYRSRVWGCGRNADVRLGGSSADGSRSKRRLYHGVPCVIKPSRITSKRFRRCASVSEFLQPGNENVGELVSCYAQRCLNGERMSDNCSCQLDRTSR